MSKSETPESDRYRKELGKLEQRICDNIHGTMRFLEGNHPRVTREEHEYCGMTLEHPTVIARFADGDVFQDHGDQVVGVALVGSGKSAKVAIIKDNYCLEAFELQYPSNLNIDLTLLTKALEQLELMVGELR